MVKAIKKVTMFDEFKVFVKRGNMMDVAIAVVMGSAFTQLVHSIITYLVGPAVGLLIGQSKLANLAFTVGHTVFQYGAVLQATLNFFFMFITAFFIIKAINSIRETITGEEVKIQNEPSEPEILEEIHGDLKKKVKTIEVRPSVKHEAPKARSKKAKRPLSTKKREAYVTRAISNNGQR